MAVSGVLIPIIALASIPTIVIGLPLARAYAKRMEQETTSSPPGVPPEVTARLERMEQALDTIAVEVERISEGQRFTTKLLSGRGELPTTAKDQSP